MGYRLHFLDDLTGWGTQRIFRRLPNATFVPKRLCLPPSLANPVKRQRLTGIHAGPIDYF